VQLAAFHALDAKLRASASALACGGPAGTPPEPITVHGRPFATLGSTPQGELLGDPSRAWPKENLL
jgi:hypothetical protein